MSLKKIIASVLSIGALTISVCAASPNYLHPEKVMSNVFNEGGDAFPAGKPNTAYEQYFTGASYLAPLSAPDADINVANVTFEPGCINNWHVHKGHCQVLVGVAGRGYYQIWGEEPKEITPGTTVTIPPDTKHWHGASHANWFQHLSIMTPGTQTEWLEPVDKAEYDKLK